MLSGWGYTEPVWRDLIVPVGEGFPGGSEVKASACDTGGLGSIPELGRSLGEGNGNPLQCSCLENPIDGGAWWATVHGVTKGRTRPSDFTFTFIGEKSSPLVIYCQELSRDQDQTQSRVMLVSHMHHLFPLALKTKILITKHLHQLLIVP